MAQYYYDNYQFEEAKVLYEAAIGDTGNFDLKLEYARLAQDMGKNVLAENTYLALLQEQEDDFEVVIDYFNFLQNRNNKEALTYILSYLELYPEAEPVQLELGILYNNINKPFSALKIFRDLESKGNQDAISYRKDLKKFLKSNFFCEYIYTRTSNLYRTGRQYRTYCFADKRVSNNFYISQGYVYQLMKDKIKNVGQGYKNKEFHSSESELIFISGSYLQFGNKLRCTSNPGKISGYISTLTFTQDFTESSLINQFSYANEIQDIWNNVQKQDYYHQIQYKNNDWTYSLNNNYYQTKRDKKEYSYAPEKLNFGHKHTIILQDQVLLMPDVNTGVFYSYTKNKFVSYYNGNPQEMHLFGVSMNFDLNLGSNISFHADYQGSFTSQANSIHIIDSSLKYSYKSVGIVLGHQYNRDGYHKEEGIYLNWKGKL